LYIDKVVINNWMIHKATTVDLFPVTVFVGHNRGMNESCGCGTW